VHNKKNHITNKTAKVEEWNEGTIKESENNERDQHNKFLT
jgi:hypothetical protein